MRRSLTLGAAFGGVGITAAGCIYLAVGWAESGWIVRSITVALAFGVLLMTLLLLDRRPNRQRLRAYGIGGVVFCSIALLAILYAVWRLGGWAMLIPMVVLAIGGEQILARLSQRKKRTSG